LSDKHWRIDNNKSQLIESNDSNPERKIMGVNYTNEDDYWQYTPVFFGSDDKYAWLEKQDIWDDNDIIQDEENEDDIMVKVKLSSVAKRLVESFSEGLHDEGQGLPIPVDINHSSMNGKENARQIGDIVDVKLYSGNDYISTYKNLHESTVCVMVKIAWYTSEIENIKNNKYGRRTSVVFDYKGAFLSLGVVQVPRLREVPPIVVNSEEKTNTATCDIPIAIEFKENKQMPKDTKKDKPQANSDNPMTSILNKLKMLADEPSTMEELATLCLDIGLTDEDITVLGSLSEDGAKKLVEVLRKATGTNDDDEGDGDGGETKTNPEEFSESLNNKLDEKITEKVKQYAQTIKDIFPQMPVITNNPTSNDTTKNLRTYSERYRELVKSGMQDAQALDLCDKEAEQGIIDGVGKETNDG